MKSILFILPGNVGGAERITITIAKSLPHDKFNVKLAVLVSDFGNIPILRFVPSGMDVLKIKQSGALSTTFHMIRCIAKAKPDVVFSSLMYINSKILPFRCLFPKIRFIIRCENYLYTFSKKQQRLIQWTYKLASRIVAQTEEMQQELIDCGIVPNRIIVLHNPIDEATIQKNIADCKSPYQDASKVNFVASGSFKKAKGFDTLVKAFGEVLKKTPNAELFIVGDFSNDAQREYYKEVKCIGSKLNIWDKVHCLGFQENPYTWMKFADCFVLSSRWEGLPNVLIESQYLGTPAAAVKCIPIIERIVKEGENGFLAEPENPTSLADAMMKACKLKNIVQTYKSASINDFIKLFE